VVDGEEEKRGERRRREVERRRGEDGKEVWLDRIIHHYLSFLW
jgi:hypothetical protein